MRPIKTLDQNVILYLSDPQTGERDPDCDLPAERCVDQHGNEFLETTWRPDPGEQRALANGAPIVLRVWGKGHPPVSVGVSDDVPKDAVALMSLDHGRRAGQWLARNVLEPPTREIERIRDAIAHLAAKTGLTELTDLGASISVPTPVGPDEAVDLWNGALKVTAPDDDPVSGRRTA